ncbi:hypothetical protein LCGC14_2384730 [marine sediment metagenome]|uniref:Uncharacterized protein n=1 Tax=marine sediment metagenome TaxID=412755 RepID=A0A0F9EUJ3_9ZZZZ
MQQTAEQGSNLKLWILVIIAIIGSLTTLVVTAFKMLRKHEKSGV